MPINENDYVGFGIDPATGKRHAINHLPAVAEWEPAVYQFEENDKIIGGVDGIDNLPLQQLANRTEYLKQHAGGVLTLPITIPTTGWTKDDADTTGYPWRIDIAGDVITEDMTPFVTILRGSLNAAQKAGLCPTVQTLDGALRVFAANVPDVEISCSLALAGAAASIATLPIASADTLGLIKAGRGLDIEADGTANVEGAEIYAETDADGYLEVQGIPDGAECYIDFED